MDHERGDIVVGVTAVQDAGAALQYAAAEALRLDCGVHVVHVLHPVWPSSRDLTDVAIIDGQLVKAGTHIVEACEQRVRDLSQGRVRVITDVVHGSVASSLTGLGEHAPEIVLQHHRMTHPHHIPTLSVTNGVASSAHVPVVGVPDTWHEPGLSGEAATEPGAPATVVVGVENAAVSGAVVATAFARAQLLGADVRMVRAWLYPPYGDIEYTGALADAEHEALLAEVRHDFEDVAAQYPEVRHEYVVTAGPAADVLVEESRQARLVVVGRHSPLLPLGSHLGPVTRSVLGHSVCPVMVTQPGAWIASDVRS
jgi:nucleotide-binding universal stress UspA family protein